jgi:ABC-2 type transport system permease protein
VAFGLVSSAISSSGATSYINNLVPGIVAYGVGFSAVFGGANHLIVWRETGLLKLLQLAPVRRSTVVGARLGSALVLGLAQTALLFAVSLLPAFGLRLGASWPYLAVSTCLGVLAFFSIGVFISNYVKTTEALVAVVNVVFLVMAVISGVFFPLSVAPAWLKVVADFMPLHYLVSATNEFVQPHTNFSAALLDLGVLAGIAIVFFSVAAKTLRWDQER